MNNNLVDIRTVGSLPDGKNHFYVPGYQRGYRWKRKQAEDLLSDLYSFNKQYELGSHNDIGDFYCLQPVIVREITDGHLREEVLGGKAAEEGVRLWELVGGQQRMTTIFIILSCLMRKDQPDKETFLKSYNSRLHTMFYESRPETKDVLESLIDGTPVPDDNIDATHINNASCHIDDLPAIHDADALARVVHAHAAEVVVDAVLGCRCGCHVLADAGDFSRLQPRAASSCLC